MAGGRDPQDELRNAGIKPGSRLQKITYNRRGKAVVALFQVGRVGSLYYRKQGSARYRKVAALGARVSYRDLVTAAAAPTVFVNLLEFSIESGGASWHGVARIDLPGGKMTPVFSEEDLKLSHPYSRGSVRELLEAWPDARGVICIMSFERPPTAAEVKRWHSQGGPGKLIAAGEHWICDLDVERKTYRLLTLLKAMFF